MVPATSCLRFSLVPADNELLRVLEDIPQTSKVAVSNSSWQKPLATDQRFWAPESQTETSTRRHW